MTEAEFRLAVAEQGYGEVKEVEYAANLDADMHTHDFTAMAMTTRGSVTLVFDDGPKTFNVGDLLVLEAGTSHAEKTGPEGASGLFAVK